LPYGKPKRYCQRRHLPSFVVERDKCVLLNLIDYIGTKCIWGLKQYIILWHSLPDDVAIEIKSDEQLLEWFELNIESEIICVDAEIKDFNGPLQFSPSKRRCHPKVRKRMSETATNEPLNLTSPYLATQNESATNKAIIKSKVDDVLSDSNGPMMILTQNLILTMKLLMRMMFICFHMIKMIQKLKWVWYSQILRSVNQLSCTM
jgi:hypothetical protein